MFGKKKEKKLMKKVLVHMYDGSGYDVSAFEHEIVIPNGCRFVSEFAENPVLLDENDKVIREYHWKPGYTVEYEYIY